MQHYCSQYLDLCYRFGLVPLIVQRSIVINVLYKFSNSVILRNVFCDEGSHHILDSSSPKALLRMTISITHNVNP